MESNSWHQLSISSRHALQWAGALARYRAEIEGADPASSAADTFDLLVGMLLEHPQNAEPKLLLEHFHLSPGQVLPADYPRPTPEAIERHMRAISPDNLPPLENEAGSIVAQGIEIVVLGDNTFESPGKLKRYRFERHLDAVAVIPADSEIGLCKCGRNKHADDCKNCD